MKKAILFMLTAMISVALFGCSTTGKGQDTKIAQDKQKFIIVDSQSPSINKEDGYRAVEKETSDAPRHIPNFEGEQIQLLLLN